jgi:hypothetical protein
MAHPSVESFVMYRLFRAGLGLTTLATAESKSPARDRLAIATTDAEPGHAQQLRCLMTECTDLLRESILGSQRGEQGGWVLDFAVAAQQRTEYDPWAGGAQNWPDTPWRRSALSFTLQFFSDALEPLSEEQDGEAPVSILTRQAESFDMYALQSIVISIGNVKITPGICNCY